MFFGGRVVSVVASGHDFFSKSMSLIMLVVPLVAEKATILSSLCVCNMHPSCITIDVLHSCLLFVIFDSYSS
jgi:hypothetical protein